MKKLLPLLVVGFLVLGGLGAVATSKESFKTEQYNIVFSQPITQNDEDFITLSIKEADSYIMEQGKPMLPCYTRSFAYPFGTKIKSVTCTPTNIEMQTISKDIMITPPITVVGQTVTNSQNVIIDSDFEPYPSDWFEYDVSGGLNDGKLSVIVNVQINPIKYYPIDKKIEWAEEAKITISYEPANEPQPVRDGYEFLIIAPDEYSDELATLVSHKIGRDITTKFTGLNEIYSNSFGRDNPEKIKYYIKDAIENWGTSSVLLVGSSTKLPSRDTHVNIEEQNDKEIFTSDLYYADIYNGSGVFQDWDTNSNDIFAEYNWNGETDNVDMHPDIFLGRWACRTGDEVTTCINKVKNYENNQAYKQDWFLNLVMVGGDSFEDSKDILEGEYANQKVIDLMTGFIPNEQWVTNGKLSGWAPTGTVSIQNAINEGCGFVDFSGHGNTNVWATHPWKQIDNSHWLPTPTGGFVSSNAQGLSNQDKLPILTIEACDTAKFKADSNCLNWAFMYNTNGGAIATFGATGLGYGSGGSSVISTGVGKLGYNTYKAYKLDGSVTLGEMWVKALVRFIPSHPDGYDWKTAMEWQVFGDPTLQIGEESNPPAKPAKPSGPTNGGIGKEHTFTTITNDPENDDLYYMFDWGDGTTSGWVGPFNSGTTASATKTWNKQGTYNIKVVAKDDHGKVSAWSDELVVTMPKSQPKTPTVDGTFTAQIGRRDIQNPEVYLEGSYTTRGQYKGVWGTATIGEKQGNFRGIYTQNHFFIKFPTEDRTIQLIGKITFDGNLFTGNWIGRQPYLRGWIEGEFNPS
jgi:hypothetical protein